MKLYTSKEQTAKLIELGFEKPKGWCNEGISNRLIMAKHKADDEGFNYSIGELIEMLPRVYTKCEIVYVLNIEAWDNQKGWDVQYFDGIDTIAHYTPANELIDALWVMIVKLKEEGVI